MNLKDSSNKEVKDGSDQGEGKMIGVKKENSLILLGQNKGRNRGGSRQEERGGGGNSRVHVKKKEEAVHTWLTQQGVKGEGCSHLAYAAGG